MGAKAKEELQRVIPKQRKRHQRLMPRPKKKPQRKKKKHQKLKKKLQKLTQKPRKKNTRLMPNQQRKLHLTLHHSCSLRCKTKFLNKPKTINQFNLPKSNKNNRLKQRAQFKNMKKNKPSCNSKKN